MKPFNEELKTEACQRCEGFYGKSERGSPFSLCQKCYQDFLAIEADAAPVSLTRRKARFSIAGGNR
jgi:hypothetical protein